MRWFLVIGAAFFFFAAIGIVERMCRDWGYHGKLPDALSRIALTGMGTALIVGAAFFVIAAILAL